MATNHPKRANYCAQGKICRIHGTTNRKRPKRPRKPRPLRFHNGLGDPIWPILATMPNVLIHNEWYTPKGARRLRDWLTRWLEWQEGQR